MTPFVFFVSMGPAGCGGLDVVGARLIRLAAGGGVVISKGTTISTGGFEVSAGNVKLPLTNYADNAAALAGGLTAGMLYHTSGTVKVVT